MMKTASQTRLSFASYLLTAIALVLTSCQTNPSVISRFGTESMREQTIERTIRAYRTTLPTTVQEMHDIFGAAPISTHTTTKGTYAIWASCETDRKGGQYISAAGCLSSAGRIISSFFQHRDPFVKRCDAQTHVYGNEALLDTLAHPGMAVALRKAYEAIGVKLPPQSAQSALLPEDQGGNAVSPDVAMKNALPQAPSGYILVPIDAIRGQVPQTAPVQQQEPNNGAVIMETINNAFNIVQKFM